MMAEDHSPDAKKQAERPGVGRIKVTLRDWTELTGHISRIHPDSFQLIDKKSGRVTIISLQDVERVHKP